MSDIYKCGLCDLLTGLLRRVMCVGNHRESNESYYRELGEQNTLRFDRRSSDSTDSSEPDNAVALGYGRKAFQKELEDMFKADDIEASDKMEIGRFHSVRRKPKRKRGRNEELLDDSYPMQVQLLLSKSSTWEFDTHDLERATGGRCLPVLCMHLFVNYGLIDFFKLLPEKCWKLFHSIEENYHAGNLYHNSVHATDVMQAVHCFLQQPMLISCMNELEIMVVLLAAITHDLDHPGVNHSFLVATHHPLAIMFKEKNLVIKYWVHHYIIYLPLLPLYVGSAQLVFSFSALSFVISVFTPLLQISYGANDRTPLPRRARRGRKLQEMLDELSATRTQQQCDSVLEHHHWRVAYSCILESGIFDHMKDRLPEIKHMLKALILATDISKQIDYLNTFKDHLAMKTLDVLRPDHRLIVLQMALKTADISNPGRSWKISQKWSLKVCSEFYNQGDQERSQNLTISYLCNRAKDSVPNIQTGFFRYIVMPLYTEWHHYLKSSLSLMILTNLIHNEAEWNRLEHKTSRTTHASSSVISAEDLTEAQLETSTGISESSEFLLQSGSAGTGSTSRVVRRSSYSPVSIASVKSTIRRYSAPLQWITRLKKNSVPECRLIAQLDPFVPLRPPQSKSMHDFRIGDRDDSGSSHNSLDKISFKELIDLSTPCRILTYSVQVDDDQEECVDEKTMSRLGPIIAEESSSSSGSQVTNTVPSSISQQYLFSSISPMTGSAPSSANRLDIHREEDRPASKVSNSCEVFTFTPVKDALDEMTDVRFPQLRTISNSDHRRRGSAPSPIAVSDLQRLASNLSLQLERGKRSGSSCHKVLLTYYFVDEGTDTVSIHLENLHQAAFNPLFSSGSLCSEYRTTITSTSSSSPHKLMSEENASARVAPRRGSLPAEVIASACMQKCFLYPY